MAITFTNNWKNILDKLGNIFRSEFGNALQVCIGNEDMDSNNYVRLVPVSSSLNDYMLSSETRTFTVLIVYVFKNPNIKKRALDHVLRFVSRIEALVHDNIAMTLADSTRAFNCRVQSTQLDVGGDENSYVVNWTWQCQHQSNLS